MTKTRKELQTEYKERKVVGGIICIKNILNGKMLLDSTSSIQASLNRFDFSKKTGSCVSMKLQKDWFPATAPPFTLEVLEELEKAATQTDADFKSDLLILKELWLEKLDGADFY